MQKVWAYFCVSIIFFVFILMVVMYFPVLLQTIWGSWVAVTVFLHFDQKCLWQSAILKFASCRVCTSTAFLCCRKGSYFQHRTEDPVTYVKEDAAARPACWSSSVVDCWAVLDFQDSHKFLRSYLIQSSHRRCACCAPSELEVAAFASLQCELEMQLKYCPTFNSGLCTNL